MGEGALKTWKIFDLIFGGLELTEDTAPGISSESKFSPESHVVSTVRGNISKLALNQHSRPQSLSVLIDQKKRWAPRMMVKRSCAHAQWRKPASKQTDDSISIRYNNLFHITLCMHWIRCFVWAKSKMRRSTDFLQESIFSFVSSVWRTRRKKPSNLNWMGIFEMNSSEFNEPCHEIHQNSNSDNCHQETNC